MTAMQYSVSRWCRVIGLVCGVAAWSCTAVAEVYRQVDAEGKVTYTDQPPADGRGEKIHMPATNAIPAMQQKLPPERAEGAVDASADKPVFKGYTRFEMSSPEKDEILGWDVTTASLVAEVSPSLREGHTIQFYLDGRALGQPGTTLFRLVSSLERGTHTAEARIRDEKGKTLRSTRAVTFHVRRHVDEDNTLLDPDLYPYGAHGARGPRGAGSVGGASEPSGVDDEMGTPPPRAARSPGERLGR